MTPNNPQNPDYALKAGVLVGSVEIAVILYYVLVRIQIPEEGGEIRQHGTGAADGAEN